MTASRDIAARLTEALDALAESRATVNRIWEALGITTYEQAGGKNISEIVSSLRLKVEELERRLDHERDFLKRRGDKAEGELKGNLLSLDDLMHIKSGDILRVTWSGGNGPHNYRVEWDDAGNLLACSPGLPDGYPGVIFYRGDKHLIHRVESTRAAALAAPHGTENPK